MAHKATPFIPSSADLAAVATSGSATDLSAGTLAAARLPAFTGGDVTSSAGSASLAIGASKVLTTMILDANVTLAKLANLAQSTVIGRNTASTGVPEAVTMAQLATLLGFSGGAWTTNAVAGAAAQNLATGLTMSGTDQDYEFDGKIVGPNATQTWTLEPNNLATNQSSTAYGTTNGGAFNANPGSFIYIGDDTATSSVYFLGRIFQATGLERIITLNTWQITGATLNAYSVTARWNVTTEITGFRLHASTATGLGIGTTMRVRRV